MKLGRKETSANSELGCAETAPVSSHSDVNGGPENAETGSPHMHDQLQEHGHPRNSSVTMDRIIAAAEREFGQKGLAGAKITDIARAAGVSKQLVYHYFTNKDTLYSEMMVTISQENYELLLKIDYDRLDPSTAISLYFTAIFDRYLQDICSATVTLEQGLHAGAQVRFDRKANLLRKELLHRMAGALKRGQAAGIFNPDLTIEQVHFMSIVVVAGCISFRDMYVRYTGVELPAAAEDDSWRQFAVDFFMRGIAP